MNRYFEHLENDLSRHKKDKALAALRNLQQAAGRRDTLFTPILEKLDDNWTMQSKSALPFAWSAFLLHSLMYMANLVLSVPAISMMLKFAALRHFGYTLTFLVLSGILIFFVLRYLSGLPSSLLLVLRALGEIRRSGKTPS